MISENIELVLNREQKSLYINNLNKALQKLNNEITNINTRKFQNLISIYSLDTKYNLNRFEEITLNKYTGLPTKISIKDLFKEKSFNLKTDKINVVEEVKNALSENKDISKIRDKYSKNKYYEDVKRLDSFDDFCDIKNTNNQIILSNYESNLFVNYRIFFDEVYKENAKIFSEKLKKKINNNSIDKPKYLSTLYERLKESYILPNNLEKHIIGPFFTNKIENEDYNLRGFVKENNSFILEYRKQFVELNKVEINKKILKIFNRKESVLEKNHSEDFVIYSTSDDIKQEVYDSFPKDKNVLVI